MLTRGIGPDDRSVKGQGRWQIDDSGKLVLEPTGAPKVVMQVLRVGPDKLVVKND